MKERSGKRKGVMEGKEKEGTEREKAGGRERSEGRKGKLAKG